MSTIRKTTVITNVIDLTEDQVEDIIKHYLRQSGMIPEKSCVIISTEGLDRLNGIRVKITEQEDASFELKLA